MIKKKVKFSLTSLDYRVFITLLELEKENLFARPLGLILIFKGESEYSNISTFRTLKNITSKRLSMRMKILLRKGYLSLKYNSNDGQLYYCLTNLGKLTATEYKNSHENVFKKYDKIIDRGIAKIQ